MTIEAFGRALPPRSPFPLRDRALLGAASGETIVDRPAPHAADPFGELVELRRRHARAHAFSHRLQRQLNDAPHFLQCQKILVAPD